MIRLSTLLKPGNSTIICKPPRDGKPPEEAIEACADKSEGEVVTFETRHGHQLEATCKLFEEQLVAVPKDHKK